MLFMEYVSVVQRLDFYWGFRCEKCRIYFYYFETLSCLENLYINIVYKIHVVLQIESIFGVLWYDGGILILNK